VEPEAKRASLLDILRPGLLGTTLLLTVGYSLHCITFYYILKWSPKIVADFGYTQPQAASVLVWANIGGAIGGGLFGFLMHKFGIKWPTIAMLAGTVAVSLFGLGPRACPAGAWRCSSPALPPMPRSSGSIRPLPMASGQGARHRHRLCHRRRAHRRGRFADPGRRVVPHRRLPLLPVSIMALGSLGAALALLALRLREAHWAGRAACGGRQG
jgi:hypothetical protein